jgi:glyoxylase-like metal-dependent hydrolase (beta-lactamase superfamily II)
MPHELPRHFTKLTDLDEARRERCPGAKVEALRTAGRALHDRLRAGRPARSVRTFSIVTFPYPTKYALGGAARSLAPYIMMTNRMQLVVFDTAEGPKRLLVNPSDWERNEATPFFQSLMPRYGRSLARKAIGTFHGDVPDHLQRAGVRPEEIDYVTFDHLHTQDCRRLLGEWAPRAKLLAMRAELEIYRRLHPLQRMWYLPDALDGIPQDRIVALDGDVQLGDGVALVATPGHTWGNHTIVLHTDRGLWTISENGVACDNYAPERSRIAGVAKHARSGGYEVLLNANTREGTLDQYASMVLEGALADRVPDAPEFPQHFSSSEMTPSLLAPGLSPTYSHGAITQGPEPASIAATDAPRAGGIFRGEGPTPRF